MAKSGLYDAVFYGHNHIMDKSLEGDTLVVNPGELAAQKSGVASFAIYDTSENTVELIELEGSISLKSDLVDAYFRNNREALDFRSEKSFKI